MLRVDFHDDFYGLRIANLKNDQHFKQYRNLNKGLASKPIFTYARCHDLSIDILRFHYRTFRSKTCRLRYIVVNELT